MKIIDLFAGAGGLSEGFRRQGTDIVAHVEMDYDASKTLKTREAFYYLKSKGQINIYKQYLQKKITQEELYSHVPKSELEKVINLEISDETFGEITQKIDSLLNDEPVDAVIGGPPCQAYSLVGRARDKDGMRNDNRNFLYQHYLKFIQYYKPKFFVFENVVGLISAQKGTIFSDIKRDMEELGYQVDYEILDSADFGVPQRRKRVIIIGWKDNYLMKYPVFVKNNQMCSLSELFEDLPAIKSNQEKNIYSTEVTTILENLKIRTDNWDILTYHKSRKNRDVDLEIYKICAEYNEKHNKNLSYNELPERLKFHKNTTSFLDRFKVLNKNGISHTMVAHISKDGHHYIHFDKKQNRSITVREAARIQTFPDDFYFESSQTSAFKQIGNAVPPLMAEKIAEGILNNIHTTSNLQE